MHIVRDAIPHSLWLVHSFFLLISRRFFHAYPFMLFHTLFFYLRCVFFQHCCCCSYHYLRFFTVPFISHFHFIRSPQVIVPTIPAHFFPFLSSLSHSFRYLNLHIFNSFLPSLHCLLTAAATSFAASSFPGGTLVAANWTVASASTLCVHVHKSILNGLLHCDVTAIVVWVKS